MGKIVLDTGVALNAHPTSWKMAYTTLQFIAANNCLASGATVTINQETRRYIFDDHRRVRKEA